MWRFYDAPQEYQDLSTNGGDEDWVVYVPDEIHGENFYARWLDYIDTIEPQKVKVYGGVLYIGAHA